MLSALAVQLTITSSTAQQDGGANSELPSLVVFVPGSVPPICVGIHTTTPIIELDSLHFCNICAVYVHFEKVLPVKGNLQKRISDLLKKITYLIS